jgi:glucan 1,3-beta-glucosidase
MRWATFALCTSMTIFAQPVGAAPVDSSWYFNTAHPPSSNWRSVTAFGAKGDGVTDDTASIQAAINHNRGEVRAKSAAVVYFPPGEYLVSGTLVMWCNTELRGSSLAVPTLRLAPSSPGFGSAAALRPVIATNAGYDANLSHAVPEWWDNSLASNDMFYMHVHNLALDISSPGNAGAVGIYWCVAQQTSLRNLQVTVGGAFSGIDICQMPGYPHAGGGGQGGGGTVEDIAISGGSYGLRGGSSQWTFRGLRLDGQRSASLWLSVLLWQFAFVDIAASNAPCFLATVGLSDYHSSNIMVIDALLTNISGPAAILHDGRGVVTFLQNATLTGPTLPGAWVANTTRAGGGGLDATWLPRRPHVERWSGWSGGDTLTGHFVGGALSPEAHLDLPGSPLRPLASRPRPTYDGLPAPPCNAIADCGAGGENATDDTAALQACIARCPAVFLPYGVYRVSDTLNLTRASVLTGEMLSNIYLAASAWGFGGGGAGGAGRPLLDTPDDGGAVVQLSDLSLTAGRGNPGAVLLRWRCGGEGSGLWDVNVNISSNVLYGVHAVGAGGGTLANVWVWGADHSWWSMAPMAEDHAEIGFLGESAGPLTAFGLACEHHHVNMIKITGAAQNYDFVVSQTEEATPIEGAADTVHLLVSDGAFNVTIYSALTCNWWSPPVTQLMAAWGVGENVSFFGLKGLGSNTCLMNR